MILGITGGLASGKTEAARTLAARGVRTIDADAIARYLTDCDPLVIGSIRDRLGESCFLAEGALDRAALGRLVFAEPEARRKLEAILHPPISAVLMGNIRWASLCSQHLVLEIPLLFESGWDQLLEKTLTVTCSEELQLQRALARGITEAEARSRIAAQMPLSLKESRSSFVVNNNGKLKDLQEAVNAIWEGCIAA